MPGTVCEAARPHPLKTPDSPQKPLVRFITCGSVDDGKSTLIGRLLYDCQQVMADQLGALEADSARYGTTGTGQLDLALLLDGLAAEREQGITIDVAYRFFATERASFIVADTPGHEQYTRNMVTGASTADVAVVLIDARKGVLTQTRRHSRIVAMMGIRQVVLAINKMDLVEWDQNRFEQIVAEYHALAQELGIAHVTAVPVCALSGEQITRPSTHMSWHTGPTLIEALEAAGEGKPSRDGSWIMPVQLAVRPDSAFRGFAGTIIQGTLRPGDAVVCLPGGQRSHIDRIVTADGDEPAAQAGQAVTLTLTDPISVSRGDVLAAVDHNLVVADQFKASLIWMSGDDLVPGRSYSLCLGPQRINAQVAKLKYAVNPNTGQHMAVDALAMNDIGVVGIILDRAVVFAPYSQNRALGGFILVDRANNQTVACGMIEHVMRRAQNVHWQDSRVTKSDRALAKAQTPRVLWFTGLSGAGKTTIADLVEQKLVAMGRHTMMLDGDNLRHGLNHDLGFTTADRIENIRRVAEVAKLMADAGLIVLVSLISPFAAERQRAREIIGLDQFIEVFVDAPLAVCEQRDTKGLYAKARRGELPGFTGIDSPYEAPLTPEVHLISVGSNTADLADQVVDVLMEHTVKMVDRYR
jgi:bifunctional enzyme CysN/CysC